MTVPAAGTNARPRRIGRSIVALLLGFLAVVVLSTVTDLVLHAMNVYPAPNQPMIEPGLVLLALTYRCAYGILGSFIAARLAPHSPMRHAMILGFVGLVISSVGVIAATRVNLGPLWYPIALALTTLPCAWLGGLLHRVTILGREA